MEMVLKLCRFSDQAIFTLIFVFKIQIFVLKYTAYLYSVVTSHNAVEHLILLPSTKTIKLENPEAIQVL